MGNPDPNGHVWYDVSSKAKCEIVEQATAALLRYLERLPFTTNTAWPMVRRCWSEAPARFDELDKRQAGAQFATRDSIATFDWVRHTDHERPVCGARRRPPYYTKMTGIWEPAAMRCG